MNFTIRTAAGTDAAEFLRFLALVGGESDNLTFGSEGLPFSAEEEAAMLEAVTPPDVFLLAEAAGRILGNVSLHTDRRARMRHRGQIAISVRREVWGQGIGSALMQAVIDHARQFPELEILNLEVRQDNLRAIRLYEKFGFRKVGTDPALMKIGGEYIDYDIMQLRL